MINSQIQSFLSATNPRKIGIWIRKVFFKIAVILFFTLFRQVMMHGIFKPPVVALKFSTAIEMAQNDD